MKLPELPYTSLQEDGYARFTEHDMRVYAAAAVMAERERCARLCEDLARKTYGMINLREYGECAEAIRKQERN